MIRMIRLRPVHLPDDGGRLPPQGGESKHADEKQTVGVGEQHGHEAEHAKVSEGTPGVLRVDPGMVRDLRVRTGQVESRPGGEGVTLLGELQVNQDRYAEWARRGRPGGPAGRRSGDVVKSGTALVEIDSVTLGRARAARGRGESARRSGRAGGGAKAPPGRRQRGAGPGTG
jgi:hypothetical protein